MGRDVEIFDAAVSCSGTVDPWVAGAGGEGTAVRYLFLDVGGACFVDDGLDVQIARRAAVRRPIEFALR